MDCGILLQISNLSAGLLQAYPSAPAYICVIERRGAMKARILRRTGLKATKKDEDDERSDTDKKG
jgi:hypothetical protein